jgi:hypothetical protein
MTANATAAEPDAPTLGQSIIVDLGLGATGIALIVVSGHSFTVAFQAPVQPVAALLGGLVLGGALGGAFGLALLQPAIAARVRPFLARFTSAAPTVPFIALAVIRPLLPDRRGAPPSP